MADTLALAAYLPLLGVAAVAVWRRPVFAVYAWIVGLAAHNAVMVALYGWGVHGAALTTIGAWKEVLLAAALGSVAAVALRSRSLPVVVRAADLLGAAFALVVVVYAVLPQSWLDGTAGAETVAYAARHALVPVAAYVLGRALVHERDQLASIAGVVVATAVAVAALGIVELYVVSLEWWRGSGAPGWFGEQLGHHYRGLSGLPENFVFNEGDEEPSRRLISTFLSPLATAYMLCVALLVVAARPTRSALIAAPLLLAALVLTHTRAAFVALAGALAVLALLRRSPWAVAAAAAVLVLGVISVQVFEALAPQASFTSAELRYQREQARRHPDAAHDPLSTDEPSLRSHLDNLRDGAERVAEHPQGFGLGNAGATAQRFDREPLAGESNYTELGVETGVVGAALFVAWAVAVFVALAAGAGVLAAAAWAGASVALVLALALQTDAVGIHWLAYVVWACAGLAISAGTAMGRAGPSR